MIMAVPIRATRHAGVGMGGDSRELDKRRLLLFGRARELTLTVYYIVCIKNMKCRNNPLCCALIMTN